MLVVEPNIPDPEILFSRVCNLGVLYTHSPCLRVQGQGPQEIFWDVCWPTVLRNHCIGLTVVFSHGISTIKESIVTRLCMVLFCIVKNICDCYGETVRA